MAKRGSYKRRPRKDGLPPEADAIRVGPERVDMTIEMTFDHPLVIALQDILKQNTAHKCHTLARAALKEFCR